MTNDVLRSKFMRGGLPYLIRAEASYDYPYEDYLEAPALLNGDLLRRKKKPYSMEKCICMFSKRLRRAQRGYCYSRS